DLHDQPPEPDQLGPHFGRVVADPGSHFDHGLVQFRLHLAEDHRILLEDLGDVAAKLAGLRVDDLVLFLDAEGEAGGFHLGLTAGEAREKGTGKREGRSAAGTGFPLPLSLFPGSHTERGSTTNTGTVLPPPAVTLSSAAVESRVRQPSIAAPCSMNGAVSCIRSIRWSRPSAQVGYGSDGTTTRSWTM